MVCLKLYDSNDKADSSHKCDRVPQINILKCCNILSKFIGAYLMLLVEFIYAVTFG